MQQGVYRHWKGGFYTVLMQGVNSTNSGDREDVVVYCSHTTGQVYVREAKEFFGNIPDSTSPCGYVNRFEFVASSIGPPVRKE